MPKTTKKTATKTVAKKAPAKKAVKKAVKPVVAKPVVADIPAPERYCHCTKRKRNTILTCTFIGSFLLGLLTYHLLFCPAHPHFGPRIEFVNGCANVESIKCPKMLQELPMIDADHNGCVTREELRAAKKEMRHHKKPAGEPAVVDAIAPVME